MVGWRRIAPGDFACATADLFVAMYVRREGVLSSQIEGTQSTLDDLLVADLEPSTPGLPDDVEEVLNYVRAMNYGRRGRVFSYDSYLALLRDDIPRHSGETAEIQSTSS